MLGLLACWPAALHAATTLNFTSDAGGAWSDGIANDGEGGSSDIAGITIEILNISDTNGTNLSGAPIEWQNNGSLGLPSGGFTGLTTFSYGVGNGSWKGISIRGASGAEFQLNQFTWYDWGDYSRGMVNVIGYRNSLQVASTTFTSNTSSTIVPVTLDSTFDNVDEVRITYASVTGWPSINAIVIDTAVALPTVTHANISISGASGTGGAYKIGDTVTATWNNTAGGDNNSGITGVTVDFSQFGGGAAAPASNSSGTWTATYTIVGGGSIDTTLRNVSVSATNAGGTTTTADQTNATVDNIAPTVTDAKISISGASGTGGAFKIGDTVTATWNNTAGGDNNSDTISSVTVNFSAFGGGSAVSANNSSGTWTATYAFVSGAIDGTNKNVSVTATDNAGNTTTTADTTNATVDSIAPTITDAKISISGASGTGGAFKIGDTVIASWNNTAGGDNNSDTISSVTVNFSAFGGGAAVSATNSSGTWTATYTIVAGAIDGTNKNVSVTVTDNAGNTTTTADTTNATLDNIAPTVSAVSVPANGSYSTGQNLDFTVNFSESVTVDTSGGTPRIALTVGSSTVYASYQSGSGSSSLVFRYTVQSGDADSNGITVGALGTNGGTLQDAVGNNATLTLNSVGSTASVLVDTAVPTVSSVNSSTANGTYKTGDPISIQVNFSEAVTVIGTPQLTLETGTTDQAVNYASGSGTATLTFTYTVQSGDTSSDLDYTSTSALVLNSGTIRDAAGNNATLTLASPGATNSLGNNKALVVDGVVPTVSSVNSSTANGTYKIGDVVSIQVNFSETVTVTGTPQLTLETGTTDQAVNYASGSGTATLTFTYTVQSGDTSSDLDYTSTSALALNSGTIRDAAGNNATLTLASPGNANSLGANQALVIDGVRPTATIVVADTALAQGETSLVTFTFNEAVTGFTNADLTIPNGTLSSVSSSNGGITWTATFTPTDGNTDSSNVITLDNAGVQDNAGNAGTGATNSNNFAIDTTPQKIITTFAGNLIPNGTATNVGIGASKVAVNSSGDVFFADSSNHTIRKIDHTTGRAIVVAGTGASGFSGDGGAATSAQLNSPRGVALDSSGNIYIADTSNHRIRKIDASTGNISTIAGTGTGTSGGDGAAATAARVNSPNAVAVDSSGNVFIADTSNNRIRKIDAGTGNISTVAGNGTGGYLADNVAATGTRINAPRDILVSSSGDFYIADTSNNRIRKVSGGTITTFAGTGSASFSGDNGVATSATIRAPQAITFDGSGNMYIADTTNHRVRKIATGTNIITTLSGTGSAGYSGDNGVATSGQLSSPAGIAVDGSGNIYIGDTGNLRLRKISGGNITTAAGTGSATYGGDGGLATSAQFTNPQQIVIDGAGNFYLSDSATHRVRKLATDGTVTTIAGTGIAGYSGDNGPATSAQLNTPLGICLDGSGNLYIADGNNNRIRKVATNGTITTFAGDGTGSFGGDNGPATSAQIFGPFGVLSLGTDLYITDTGNNRVRKVNAGGTITTVAGDGTANYGGDNGPATSAQMNTPVGIAADSAGNIYVTDYSNGSIRKISTGGTMTTVAGNGANGYGGDGGAATSAQLNSPRAVAVDSANNIYITDTTNSRIRKVDATTGNISTIAGDGNAAFSGDGGLAVNAQVSTPQAITIDAAGVIYIGDTGNRRFRRIGPALPATVTYNGNGSTGGAVPVDAGSPYDTGTTVTVLGNTGSLAKTGYTFSGWNTAADGSGSSYTPSGTFLLLGNTTLYAKWTVSPVPSAPTGFGAAQSGSAVSLTWTNPTDLSFDTCTIRRSTSAYPTSITDGSAVATGLTGTSYSDTGVGDGVYYYAIFALNSVGGASTAATASVSVDLTPPAAPVLLATKSNPAGSTIDLSWTVPATTATFTLRRSTSAYPTSISDGTLVQANIASSTTSLSQTSLPDGTYYYALFALDSIGNISAAGTASATIDTTAPAAPTGFTAVATGSNVALIWTNPVLDFASCTLRRSTAAYPTSVTDGSPVASNQTGTSYDDNGLADGTYYYALFALDAFGNVSNSATATVTVDTTPPAAPTLTATKPSATGSTIDLSWTVPSTTATFTLRRSTSAYPTSITDGTLVQANIASSTTSLSQTSLADGTYYYALFAFDGVGNVSAAGTATATVDTTAPNAPTAFTAVATGGTIALNWTNPVSDFASCTIRRSTSAYPTTVTGGTAVASGLTGTSFSDTSLADGKYYYALFALDATGNVSVAATASATADSIVPTVVSSVRTASSYPTNATSVGFTVTFSEAVSGVDATDFTLTTTGTAGGNITAVSTTSITVRQVTVSGLTGQGTIRLDVKSSGTGIVDGASNALSGGFTAGELYTIDRTVPAAFDLAGYFSRYPDIAALYGSDPYAAWIYYRDHGIYDGEVFDDEFRVEEYLEMYPDLLAAYGTDLTGALMHWLTIGRTEGRLGRIPVAFDAQGYLDRNPDVATAVGGSLTLAWQHFWSYGIYEGREYNDEFNAFEYLAINADLTAVYVNDWRAGTLHWLRYGRLEGRLGSIPQLFNLTTYLTRNPDVAAVWGTNPTTVFLHFWLYGIDEGRTFDDEFRVDEYLALNPSLAAVYGSDRRGAFKHWVRYGRAEGRPGKNP